MRLIFSNPQHLPARAGLFAVIFYPVAVGFEGRGIAVAFVATTYGVGIANLFFLPFAGKIRIHLRMDIPTTCDSQFPNSTPSVTSVVFR